MKEDTLVKIVAIVCLSALEIVNMFTAKIDGNVLLTLGAIIGGIAGYSIRTQKKKSKKKTTAEK